MPKLRRIGNALQESGNALQQIALRMYQKQLDDEQQREAHRMRTELQRENNADQAGQNLLTRQGALRTNLMQHPDVARRMARTGEQFEGIDPSIFAPSDEEVVGKLGSKIGVAPRGQMPGDLAIESELKGEGISRDPRPIEELMGVRNERERRLTEDELRTLMNTKERYDEATGRKVIGQEGAEVPLGPTPAQEGRNARTTALEGELHPEIVKAAAKKAGATSYASSAGSTRGTMDTEFGNLGKVKAIADAKRGPGTGAGGGPIQARENSAKGMLESFKTLSKRVNSRDGWQQLVQGGIDWAGTFINRDNVDIMFNQMRKPLGLTLAVIIQGSRPTDKDAQIFVDVLPGFTTPGPVAEALIEEVEKLLSESGMSESNIAEIMNARPGTRIPNIRQIPNALERLLQVRDAAEKGQKLIDWVPGGGRQGGPGPGGRQ